MQSKSLLGWVAIDGREVKGGSTTLEMFCWQWKEATAMYVGSSPVMGQGAGFFVIGKFWFSFHLNEKPTLPTHSWVHGFGRRPCWTASWLIWHTGTCFAFAHIWYYSIMVDLTYGNSFLSLWFWQAAVLNHIMANMAHRHVFAFAHIWYYSIIVDLTYWF
jgi:hypothetical protein